MGARDPAATRVKLTELLGNSDLYGKQHVVDHSARPETGGRLAEIRQLCVVLRLVPLLSVQASERPALRCPGWLEGRYHITFSSIPICSSAISVRS